ncbi:MAG: DNA polymerase III subunit beta [Elusimicrobiales bacterium]
MKFIIKQEKLIECLNKIQPAIQSKTGSMPVLHNFLIDVRTDSIKFISTDLEIAIRHILKDSFSTIIEGTTTIPFKKFHDIVSTIDKDKEITVSYEDDKVNIISGKIKMKISTFPSSDFPATPLVSDKETFRVNAFDIVSMIEKTIFSSSTDDKNTVLNGLLWKKEKDIFTIAATDGRRLAVISRKISSEGKLFKVVIPSRILEEVCSYVRLCCSERDEMSINISTNQVGFKINNTEFVSRFIEGNFPSYESIIPKSFESIASIDCEKLMTSTKRAVIAGGDNKNGFVKYVFKKDVLTVTLSTQSVDFEDQIDCNFSHRGANEFVIVYNPRFIIDILKNSGAKNIEFRFTGSTTPTMITVDNEPDLMYMIMPLKSY